MVNPLLPLLLRSHIRMWNILPNLQMISCDNNERLDFQILRHLIAILVSVGNAEGRVDPAVGVHHVLGHIGVNDAVNGVTLRH